MLKLDDVQWGRFVLKDLFTWSKGRYLSAEDRENFEGDIPCVNGGAVNNGILCFLNSEITSKKFQLQKAPCLSLSRVGNSGLTFVQSKDFYIADNAYSLRLKYDDADVFVYMFISTVLNCETFKYSYGRIINSGYFDTVIRLPVLKEGVPHWDFMRDYIKQLVDLEKIDTKVKPQEKPIEVSKWKNFIVKDIFECGTTKPMIETASGDSVYITRSATDNGFSGLVSSGGYVLNKANCITIGAEGRVAFYQDTDFVAGVKIYTLRNEKLNKYNAMFICTLLNQDVYRYSYGRARVLDKIRQETIKLPADKDGNPDWAYMENYIKSLPYADKI